MIDDLLPMDIYNVILYLEYSNITNYFDDIYYLFKYGKRKLPCGLILPDEIKKYKGLSKYDFTNAIDALMNLKLVYLSKNINDNHTIINTIRWKSLIDLVASNKRNDFINQIDKILENKDALSFSDAYFEKVFEVKSSKVSAIRGYVLFGPDNNWIPYSSLEEIYFINELVNSHYADDIKGQNFPIPYKIGNRAKEYYPDFYFINYDKKQVCFVEIKKLYDMPSKLNQLKYKALEKYCLNHGYRYTMCDSNLNTIDSLFDIEIDKSLHKNFNRLLNLNGFLDYDDIHKIIEKYSKIYDEDDVKNMIAAIVYKENLYFEGNLSGSSKIIIKESWQKNE